MEIILGILLGMVSLICLSGGLNLLIKGSGSFLPQGTMPPPILDDLFRFLSGIYFSLGFLVAWVVFHIQQENDIIYFIGLVVLFSGLGRFYSRIKVGSAGKYFDSMMILEIVLGIIIIELEYLRVR